MTPLNPDTHGALGWRAAVGFGFARDVATVALADAEIRRAAQVMPVAFRHHQGQWQAVAVMGPVAGTNIYVAKDGRWRAAFVPAALRTYPFCLNDDDQLCLWDGYTAAHRAQDDVAPFYDGSTLAPRLQDTHRFLRNVAQGQAAVDRALQEFQAQGLLRPWAVPGLDQTGSDHALCDLHQIDALQLHRLSDQRLASLVRSGTLAWVHAHLDSLHHAERFKALAQTLVNPAIEAPRKQDPAEQAADILAAIAADLRDDM